MSYSDKVLTTNKYDKELYNAIKKNDLDNLDLTKFNHNSYFITEFLKKNNIIHNEGKLNQAFRVRILFSLLQIISQASPLRNVKK